jgi:peptidoglycan/xylan/chitin deacetylase (PgdA/CDA1 family)
VDRLVSVSTGASPTHPDRSHGHLRGAAWWVLWATGVSNVAYGAIARRGRFALLLHGISSHRLRDVFPEAQPHLTSDDLAHLLRWLGRRFMFLTPTEYLAASKPGVLLTFDDGFANNFRNALPVLHAFGAPAILFVSTQHVANPRDWLSFVRLQAERGWGSEEAVPENVATDWYDGMSVEELRQCSAHPLVTIGSHGVAHTVLTECGDEQLVRELRESKSFLERVTGTSISYFAYPRGDYDTRVARQTEAAGYTAAFAVDPIGLRMPHLELPRVGIYEVDRKYLSLKLSGLHRRPLPVWSR